MSSTPMELSPLPTCRCKHILLLELKQQRGLILPLIISNLSYFIKITITTSFLGHLGSLNLAGGTLGMSFAIVTGYSVLNGLCGAMEPICGQAHGAKNTKLLHKTLLMFTSLLLLTSIPIAFLWLKVDKILTHFGQQDDIIATAKTYLFYLLPSLVVRSFLCPLRTYLSTQGRTTPVMIASALAAVLHIPINLLLSKSKGLAGVAMTVWISDLITVLLLLAYVLFTEADRSWKDGGWFDQRVEDWVTLLKLSGPCCLTTSLEWWCYEILVILSGHLPNAKESLGILTIVFSFNYLIYSVIVSLATAASIRVSNLLGAGESVPARNSAQVSVVLAAIFGCFGGLIMVSIRGVWGKLFSHDMGVLRGVKRMMVVTAAVEMVNFPMGVLVGVLRGTARPSLAVYANLVGFYFLTLPVGVMLGFTAKLGLKGLLLGLLVGASTCLVLLVVSVARIDWELEAEKAKILVTTEVVGDQEHDTPHGQM